MLLSHMYATPCISNNILRSRSRILVAIYALHSYVFPCSPTFRTMADEAAFAEEGTTERHRPPKPGKSAQEVRRKGANVLPTSDAFGTVKEDRRASRRRARYSSLGIGTYIACSCFSWPQCRNSRCKYRSCSCGSRRY